MEIFLTIAILHLFAVASPGPDFLLVTRQCLRFDRTVAIWASAGIATGILFHSFIAITGVTLIISSNPEVFRWLKVLASIYIAYLGYLSIFKSSTSVSDEGKKDNENYVGSFTLGLITNILNPKAILFFITVDYYLVFTGYTCRSQLSSGLLVSLTSFQIKG